MIPFAAQRDGPSLQRSKPRILFLDEGTANLDEASEAAIADLIEAMPITRIVVAHRPALIRRAQRVYLLKEHRLFDLSQAANPAGETSGAAVAMQG
jgi:ATP-binding cassette subfamily B protein RaxB